MQQARSNKIRFKVSPSQDQFNHLRETEYCIKYSKKHFDSKKQQTFLNKCSFEYSLQKINKEKFYGNMLPYASKAYPAVYSKGVSYCHHQYSSDLVKETKKRLLSERYRNSSTEQFQKQDIRKYKHLLSKKKNQQGGIDSFWIFKKDPTKEEKNHQKGQGKAAEGESNSSPQNTANKIKQAFIKLLMFAKLPLEVENSLVARNAFKNYIASIFGETFTLWFINFYQIKAYLNFKEFEAICEKFKSISLRECHLVSFFLYDNNGDGFLCPRDFFVVFKKQLSPKIDSDILKISLFVKNNLGKEIKVNEEYKIENVCIRDDWLTIKDYEMYFKKLDEPYLKATNKKDTVFSKSFAVLDHRQKIRSKRKEMNEKKNFYEELYGEIFKSNKNEAYLDSVDDYKLNYSAMFEIFEEKSTELYRYFMNIIFGTQTKDLQ